MELYMILITDWIARMGKNTESRKPNIENAENGGKFTKNAVFKYQHGIIHESQM